ncbi:adenine deaminase [Fluviicoccus keumensis]|uniref:Adenine deaminase n=1 Tax=Fluviicoccus keumensis TaxID=1435465 RepID=A0A4Q7Z5X1_9GAMM|nr:adenine deaminase [Fluviicoccus keumensis]RZU45113.1 adenine deaminase [Fluviicoccus keumensis]
MTDNSGSLTVNVVDIDRRSIGVAEVCWENGVITAIRSLGPEDRERPYLIPGFIDAHIHLESSLLPPAEFARLAVRHGTVATVSDPHEIANILGNDGVLWMLENVRQTPFHVLLGAPSCVPATPFETAGAVLEAHEVEALLDTPGVGYLSEVMNFPGVLAREPHLMAKITAAALRHKPVDGHAPGLLGAEAAAYAAAGIHTDHECATLAEAEEKLANGMAILIREGSAARNFEALHPLIGRYPGKIMFCSDDRHPDDLSQGHINKLAMRAVRHGHDVFSVLEAACLTPRRFYPLDLGEMRVGDAMNAALLENVRDFNVLSTWLNGVIAAENGECCLQRYPCRPVNRFAAQRVESEQLRIAAGTGSGQVSCRVIGAEDGQLLTRSLQITMNTVDRYVAPSVTEDVLLLAVINRYHPAPPALALIRGFGLKCGALASSVAHDSHNIVAVGCDAESLALAINTVIDARGGLVLANAGRTDLLPLPLAGLMSDGEGNAVAAHYSSLTHQARTQLGCSLRAPFMTLSFMALLVIPELKLSDRGLFDGGKFAFSDVVCY